MNDQIPFVAEYRGVGIHDCQPVERINKVVKPEIDRVHKMSDIKQLYEFAKSALNSPEARLLAGAKCEAIWAQSTDDRTVRPSIPLEYIIAATVGLDSVRFRNPELYCSDLDPTPPNLIPRRIPPIK